MNHMVAGLRVGAPDLLEETQGFDLAFALFAKRYPGLFSVLSLSVLHAMVGLGTHCTTQRWEQRKRRQKSGSLVGLMTALVVTSCMSVPRRTVVSLVAPEVARDVAHIHTRIYHLRRTAIGSLVTGSREEWYWVSRGVPVAGPGVVAPREIGWEIGWEIGKGVIWRAITHPHNVQWPEPTGVCTVTRPLLLGERTVAPALTNRTDQRPE